MRNGSNLVQLRCVCPGQTTELNFCVSKLLAGAVPWKPAMSESASSSMGFTICSLKIFLLTLRADIKADSMEGSHFLWTFTKKIYSLGLAKLRWLWFKYCSWIAREVLKKKCEFSNRLWRQNWLPCLLRDGLFCAWGYRNKKRPLKPSVAIHLSLSLTRLVPRWLPSGITLVLFLSWAKQVFFSIYFLS